ncbi:probable pectin methylesterase CGR3 [Andrographis paniculata]|uniref:probable pectin methylesterase CGR3 n=1 Tax=Andrographis paniculata TaxID=175694 RepID=UPI0021E8F24D|nr:probable pectin methylesterase CGR3 [Andrographis paniculata]
MATRRPVNPARRVSESDEAPHSPAVHSRSHPTSQLTIALIFLGSMLLVAYLYQGRGTTGNLKAGVHVEGDFSCTAEVERVVPLLKKAYGDSMRKVLHVGPDTCSIISKLIKEDDTEAWGVEPYDIEDANRRCKRLVHRGLVRVANIKFPLPYRSKSFSLVIISDALDYLSPKYLNRTLPELARLSSDGLIIFSGYPRHHKAKSGDKAKYGSSAKLRSTAWWVRFFLQKSLEENEAVVKKFERASEKASYNSNCQIFHLKSYN